MTAYLQQTFFTFLGGAISGIVGLCLFFYKRKREPRDSFLVFIKMQRECIDTHNCYGWHDRTKPEFRAAIPKVYPFLSRSQQSSMDTIWREYQAISCQQLQQDDSATEGIRQELEAIGKEPRTPKPIEILNAFLDRFEKTTK